VTPSSYRITVAFVDNQEEDIEISPYKQQPNVVDLSTNHPEHHLDVAMDSIASVLVLNVSIVLPSCDNIFLGTM
jgi:hypothetical protein